ncbi:MAG: hypothetical protein MJ211_05850 [Bacteroidales bacterium]|nr:hypothetical protein [Bacteroidales bacterium]
MTDTIKNRCHAIIHTCAVACGAGNAVSVPGIGYATDVLALTIMTTQLAAVFGQDVSQAIAKSMAIAAIKKQVTKQPVKYLAKELGKLIPGLGNVIAPILSASIIEAAGWSLVKQFNPIVAIY